MVTRCSPLTPADLLNAPAVVPLWPDAGRAFAFGRTKTFELHRQGQFPVTVLRLGGRLLVRRADLLRALGIEDVPQDHRGGSAA